MGTGLSNDNPILLLLQRNENELLVSSAGSTMDDSILGLNVIIWLRFVVGQENVFFCSDWSMQFQCTANTLFILSVQEGLTHFI